MNGSTRNEGMVSAITAMGGLGALAEALEVTTAAVGQWRDGVRQVPAERCVQIESLTHGAVRCEQLRPDVQWSVLRQAA